MSTSTSYTRPLPPTPNAPNAHERTRLVRSPQKLGSVSTPQPAQSGGLLPIGCAAAYTPFSLRSSSPASRPSTPGSVYSSSSTNSSMASLALPTPRTSAESLAEPKGYSATARGRRSKELPRPLVLRLNAVPMPPNDRRAALPPTPTTARSSSAPPATPTTPMPPSSSELRRKRMAKLARTLGENVPVDLVFPETPAPPPAPEPVTAVDRALPPLPLPATTAFERARRRRSMSVDLSQAAAAVLAPRSSRIWVTGGSLWTGEWNRKDIREVQQQLRRLR
ncbi:uncharacterized protein C8Q71DRAFT_450610 [Rhodofomes roseus]|uniref:Uncharacterized protein n=1 Tax=Rhodofomes roseus TaxID=34475 RepID=A0ABQ8JXT5_9APHY|nr:uncharacterized protein C8Q71DRAFT_450610 [Rhodofomes roseus]KAH9829036.1 hypothetical protein C8Q71DRAFT_450610 [Rhodofomes roseus]